jgi:hypothetical protein
MHQGISDVQEGISDVQQGISDVQQGISDAQQGISDVHWGIVDVQEGTDEVQWSIQDVRRADWSGTRSLPLLVGFPSAFVLSTSVAESTRLRPRVHGSCLASVHSAYRRTVSLAGTTMEREWQKLRRRHRPGRSPNWHPAAGESDPGEPAAC